MLTAIKFFTKNTKIMLAKLASGVSPSKIFSYFKKLKPPVIFELAIPSFTSVQCSTYWTTEEVVFRRDSIN